ncbi:ATP-binding cassette sub-family C member 3-like [Oppia nitens]|uniref:ATP-binding cassette sub-family C member 3-like n=1 Tax=Oppia nitens TaxID=1686743 RepID=UPI0023DBFA7D|nr:ATP-binding cassette sub-family C member 3-like [Oppia nitens]
MSLFYTVSKAIQQFVLVFGSILVSKRMHKKLLSAIIWSPMSFFDTTPLGRIINRFSKDIDTLDNIKTILNHISEYSQICLSGIITVLIKTPLYFVPFIVMAIIFYVTQHFFTIFSSQLKRLESITRSPIYAYFSETLNGLSTIKAYGCSDRFIRHMESLIDTNQKTLYVTIIANSCLQILMDIISSLLILFAILFVILKRNLYTGGDTGMSLSNVIILSFNLGSLVLSISKLEESMVSFERLDEYSRLKPETDLKLQKQLIPNNWPNKGCIDFQQYCSRYRDGLDLVLNKINFSIKSGEKIGIVGRTGAGKSSITLALFRLIEASSGKIIIDGIDISEVDLHELRTRLTILPQDPVLYSGTIRLNLDPLGICSDDDLWIALEHSHLKSFVKSCDGELDYRVTDCGDNISVGQRQLICLARALIRKTRILILDEASAAVDVETDALIQQTIRQHFKSCTVLTIAHRLNTIMDSDRVLVLNEGRVAEFDSPMKLLTNSSSIFYCLSKDAGLI